MFIICVFFICLNLSMEIIVSEKHSIIWFFKNIIIRYGNFTSEIQSVRYVAAKSICCHKFVRLQQILSPCKRIYILSYSAHKNIKAMRIENVWNSTFRVKTCFVETHVYNIEIMLNF